MRKKERYEKILAWFRENVPVAETELHYDNPFELLIAVILSAQCTDKRVNMITPALYRDFPTPEALAATTPDVVYEYIRSVSYPNNKAKHLVGMAQMLVKEFNSEVPDTLEELVKLPGVGVQRDNRHILFHGVLPSFLAIYFNQFNRFNSILRDFPPHVKPIPRFFSRIFGFGGKKCSWHAGCMIK